MAKFKILPPLLTAVVSSLKFLINKANKKTTYLLQICESIKNVDGNIYEDKETMLYLEQKTR